MRTDRTPHAVLSHIPVGEEETPTRFFKKLGYLLQFDGSPISLMDDWMTQHLHSLSEERRATTDVMLRSLARCTLPSTNGIERRKPGIELYDQTHSCGRHFQICVILDNSPFRRKSFRRTVRRAQCRASSLAFSTWRKSVQEDPWTNITQEDRRRLWFLNGCYCRHGFHHQFFDGKSWSKVAGDNVKAGTLDSKVAAIWHCLNHYAYQDGIFLSERLHCEVGTEDSLHTLATSYYRAGKVGQAYNVLEKFIPSAPKNKFLMAKCCLDLKKYQEAEHTILSNPKAFGRPMTLDEIKTFYGDIACFVYQMVFWVGVRLLSVAYSFPTFCIWFWMLSPLRVFVPGVYRWLEGVAVELLVHIMADWVVAGGGYYILEIGDRIEDYVEDICLYAPNHLSSADVPLIMSSMSPKWGFYRKCFWIMLDTFRFLPFGIVSRINRDYFIRGGNRTEEDRREVKLSLRSHINDILRKEEWDRKFLVIFPEGGYLRNCIRQKIVRNYLLDFGGCLLLLLLEYPGEAILKWYIDVTIGYWNNEIIHLADLWAGGFSPRTTVFYYRVFPVSEIPFENEPDLMKWMVELYEDKEAMLKKFYRLCTDNPRRANDVFVDNYRTSHRKGMTPYVNLIESAAFSRPVMAMVHLMFILCSTIEDWVYETWTGIIFSVRLNLFQPLGSLYSALNQWDRATEARNRALRSNPFLWTPFSDLCDSGQQPIPSEVFQVPSVQSLTVFSGLQSLLSQVGCVESVDSTGKPVSLILVDEASHSVTAGTEPKPLTLTETSLTKGILNPVAEESMPQLKNNRNLSGGTLPTPVAGSHPPPVPPQPPSTTGNFKILSTLHPSNMLSPSFGILRWDTPSPAVMSVTTTATNIPASAVLQNKDIARATPVGSAGKKLRSENTGSTLFHNQGGHEPLGGNTVTVSTNNSAAPQLPTAQPPGQGTNPVRRSQRLYPPSKENSTKGSSVVLRHSRSRPGGSPSKRTRGQTTALGSQNTLIRPETILPTSKDKEETHEKDKRAKMTQTEKMDTSVTSAPPSSCATAAGGALSGDGVALAQVLIPGNTQVLLGAQKQSADGLMQLTGNTQVLLGAQKQSADKMRKSACTWIVMGNCFSCLKNHEVAIKFFHRAIQLDCKAPYPFVLLGLEYILSDELEKASSCFKNALTLNEREYKAWNGLGLIAYKQERFHEAIYFHRRALSINGNSSVLLCHLGLCLNADGKYQEALEVLEKSSRCNPNNPLTKYHYATALYSCGRYEEALREVEELKRQQPKEALVYLLASKIYKKLNNLVMARTYFYWARDLDPKATDPAVREDPSTSHLSTGANEAAADEGLGNPPSREDDGEDGTEGEDRENSPSDNDGEGEEDGGLSDSRDDVFLDVDDGAMEQDDVDVNMDAMEFGEDVETRSDSAGPGNASHSTANQLFDVPDELSSPFPSTPPGLTRRAPRISDSPSSSPPHR
ncbi:unnamed protein product [Cyprideis torosa]|uniref:Cell division cycle protein 27 homolog n=1 Tax=Cyprideis torosa TaxID=163714 RepID=A0A7R8W7T3_9CRUS|nr:unnamed protein product [Cyprideis torosa]CAG0883569.1 unnamed protein product [Cyprideis torosa]